MELYTALFYGITAFIAYKILDLLLRLPKVSCPETRHVLITGCDSGFGKAAVIKIDQLIKCHVFAACLTEAGESELRRVCSSRVTTLHMDVTDQHSIRQAFTFIKQRLQANGLWGIVNNAGIMGMGKTDWLKVEDFKRIASVNLYGLIDVISIFLPLVKKAKGRIVNTSSISARVGQINDCCANYSVSKYGVEAFSDALRLSMKPFDVSVHMVEPGGVKTEIFSYWKRDLVKSWNEASEDVKDDYGPDYLENIINSKQAQLDMGLVSEDLEPVVSAYMHSLFGRYPRARYLVGMGAKILVTLSWMPEWVADALVYRLLLKDEPILAIEKK